MKRLLSLLSLMFGLSAFGAGAPYLLNLAGYGTNENLFWRTTTPDAAAQFVPNLNNGVVFEYAEDSGPIQIWFYTVDDAFFFQYMPIFNPATASTFAGFDVNKQLTSMYDGNVLTNLHYAYLTNAIGSSGVLSFGGNAYMTNLQANITLAAFGAVDTTLYETIVLQATNSTSTDRTITMPNGVVGTPGLGVPPVFFCTNKVTTIIFISHYGRAATNAYKIDIAP